MYADLDYEAVRNMDSLLQGHSVYLADMNSDKANIGLAQLVPNAWMASVPRHPFWLICLQRVIHNSGYLEGYMDAERDMDKCVSPCAGTAAPCWHECLHASTSGCCDASCVVQCLHRLRTWASRMCTPRLHTRGFQNVLA